MSEAQTVSVPDLDALLSRCIRSYIDAHERPGVGEQEQHARDLGSLLARLLGRYLEGLSEWNRYRWIDDLTSTSIVPRTTSSLEVRGLIVWGERGVTKQWAEPFLASLDAPTDDRASLTYELAFGSTADGLGRFPYGAHGARSKPLAPEGWLFVFRKEVTTGTGEP